MTAGGRQPEMADSASSLLLTASENLAREYRERLNLERARDSDKSVWEIPRIQSFSNWLIETWIRTWPDEQLLSPAQEIAVWRDIIERDPVGDSLLSSVGAAREARRTDDLLRRFAPELADWPAQTEEERAFLRWRLEFDRRKADHQWLNQPEIACKVAALFSGRNISSPGHIQLTGFSGPMDAGQEKVLSALSDRNCNVEWLSREALTTSVDRFVVSDDIAQFRLIAGDIRLRLAAQRSENPPRMLIALPDQESRRDLLESCLRDLVAPWVTSGDGDVPWRWEPGDRLTRHPLVDSMLSVLELQLENNDASLISRVLLSPVIWSEHERVCLAGLDWQLRNLGWSKIGIKALLNLPTHPCPDELATRFSALSVELQAQTRRQLPSQWADHFRNTLRAIGWPGSDALDSESFQAVRSAMSLLDQLGTLDEQLGKIPRSSVRHWLIELASGARFSPRVEHAQPILITSLEAASQLSADVLYIADASTDAIPGAARPAAFVPLSLQKELGIPIASADRMLADARSVSQTLLNVCASQVQVMVPQIDARGAELRPSSLLGESDQWNLKESASSVTSAVEKWIDGTTMVSLPDSDPVPPILESELAELRVGSGLFKAWFESPFFAFCRYRLGIEDLPAPALGLEARDQGVLVHSVLERFWNVTRSSENLLVLSDQALEEQLAKYLDESADRHLPAQHFGKELRRLEIARSKDLVLQWLSHEKRRVDQFAVENCEVVAEPQIAGLRLRLVLDRVDRVKTPLGDRWLVLDYKTGKKVETRGWKSAVMSEPQLPLYASHAAREVAGLDQVDGICFAHVKDGHPALVAQTNWRKKLIEDAVLDTSEGWNESLAEWRAAIEDAARGFMGGVAVLDPKVSSRSWFAELLSLAPEYSEEAADVDSE